MMPLKELRQLINEVQKRQTESDHVEVKAARNVRGRCLQTTLRPSCASTRGMLGDVVYKLHLGLLAPQPVRNETLGTSVNK